MKRLLFLKFNIDTGCVELKYSDATVLSINCTAVENEVAETSSQRAELGWLIYNLIPIKRFIHQSTALSRSTMLCFSKFLKQI